MLQRYTYQWIIQPMKSLVFQTFEIQFTKCYSCLKCYYVRVFYKSRSLWIQSFFYCIKWFNITKLYHYLFYQLKGASWDLTIIHCTYRTVQNHTFLCRHCVQKNQYFLTNLGSAQKNMVIVGLVFVLLYCGTVTRQI